VNINVIQNELEKLQIYRKNSKIGFSIGNTNGYEASNKFYFTPLRVGSNLVHSGVIVKDIETAIEIAKKVDGQVDYIFIDVEKKMEYRQNISSDSLKILIEYISDSIVLPFKGNDLTERAVSSLLAAISPNISEELISIVGVGNMGIKIALALSEGDNEIILISNDFTWAEKVSKLVNAVKLPQSLGRCSAKKYEVGVLKDSTILIATSTIKSLIRVEDIKFMKNFKERNQPILIDVGKGCFSEDILQTLKLDILRVDVGIQLTSEFENLIKIHTWQGIAKYEEYENGVRLVKVGHVGRSGDIIVDNPVNPRHVFGVCDEKGNLLPLNLELKKYKFLENLNKK